ncbi:rhomboid family intramembrane serine protease [Methylopila musalis]|uniref:Rhomboid family intramembrane serine protease n=1 Tax=Methylopila musalis TaxID=1134781 RepID=A0ABW3Z7H5_9HYPH
MFVPILDDAPVRRIKHAWVNNGFIALCLVVYVAFQSGWLLPAATGAAVSFGLIPSVLFGEAVLPEGYEVVPPWATLVTSLVLHGGVLHLIGNLLFLWVFGDNVEDDLGHVRYVLFVLLCGIGGGVAHAAAASNPDAPLVGASGVVAGVVAAYVMLHPQVKVWVLVFYRLPVRLRAFWIIGAWVAFQLGNALLAGETQVAWWAHVGGFLTGAVLVVALKRRDVPLFDRDLNARIRRRGAETAAEDPA